MIRLAAISIANLAMQAVDKGLDSKANRVEEWTKKELKK